MNYDKFLSGKLYYGQTKGFDCLNINPILFDFQKDIVKWACKKGRCAIFADCGLGKTFMQITYANNIPAGKTIIFAPLSVNEQTIGEGIKLGINITRYDIKDECKIKICNYENIDKVNPDDYNCIIIDESSILKSVDSKTKMKIIEFAKNIEYRLACTATPAPNDISEIANHVEFLGIMKREEMLSKWFYNNGKNWVIKGHAINKFYEWMSTWGCFISKPSDLGYDDCGFDLPRLNIDNIVFDYEHKESKGGQLSIFNEKLHGIEDRIKIRKNTVNIKAQKIADIINNSNEQWICWCGIDLESKTLYSLIDDASNLTGSDSPEMKLQKINDFKQRKIKVLITKPKIAGFGMNFQNSHNAVFFGLSDSYESYYQCIRRQYRFGQKNDVNIYIAIAGNEQDILDNVNKKERQSREIMSNIVGKIKKYEEEEIKNTKHERIEYMTNKTIKDSYTVINGDSCVELRKIDSNSIDLSVFSPPFASLYTYSNSDRDLGNCQNESEFFVHFKYIVNELLRVIKPGRNVSVHCMNLPTRKIKDGYIGIKDFRGDIIRLFQDAGFIYHAEVCIQKNPQVAAIRTHAKGLMFKQMKKDSIDSRMGIPDYICTFKKPGENSVPIKNDISNDEWIKFAHPIWTDIRETYTLNSIKADKDEKHICPLQLDVIERIIRLYSNKKETVLSPFSGVGSEGYMALNLDRNFYGIELKEEYYNQSIVNLNRIIEGKKQCKLFY